MYWNVLLVNLEASQFLPNLEIVKNMGKWNILKERHNTGLGWWCSKIKLFGEEVLNVAISHTWLIIFKGRDPRAQNLQGVCFWSLISEGESAFSWWIHDCFCKLSCISYVKQQSAKSFVLLWCVHVSWMHGWMDGLLFSMELGHMVQNLRSLWRGIWFNNDCFRTKILTL